MPEENAVRFKSQLEAEVAALLRKLPPEIPKVFLCDAARSLCTSQRKAYKQQRTFFANNASMMTYAQFRRRGLPIGSGPVEAACKTLIKQRLCQSGMRWSSEGGQAILDLRAYIKSGRWDSMWKHCTQLENAA